MSRMDIFTPLLLQKVPETAIILLMGKEAQARTVMFKSKRIVFAPHPARPDLFKTSTYKCNRLEYRIICQN